MSFSFIVLFPVLIYAESSLTAESCTEYAHSAAMRQETQPLATLFHQESDASRIKVSDYAYALAPHSGRIAALARSGYTRIDSVDQPPRSLLPHKSLYLAKTHCGGVEKLTPIYSMIAKAAYGRKTYWVFDDASKNGARTNGDTPDVTLGFCARENGTCGASEQISHYHSDLWDSDAYAWTQAGHQHFKALGHFRFVRPLPCFIWKPISTRKSHDEHYKDCLNGKRQ